MCDINEILKYFSKNIYKNIYNVIEKDENLKNKIREIRIRVNKPIIIRTNNQDIIIEYFVNQEEILETLSRLCENSIYAYKNQICEGFITIKGGHRVGITGSCVIENGKVLNIKYVSSLNFRIAREVINCSQNYLDKILDLKNQTIFNTIIVGKTGSSKTTILRDIVRNLSNGIEKYQFQGKTCGIVDERGEIAATFRGIPQNDVGIRTDVIENVSKPIGINMLIRSMAPEIIVCDEIGSKQDVLAIEYAIHSGVKGIFTMHGKNLEDVKNNQEVYKLISNKSIEKILFL